jgi:carboxypeptidase Q
MRRRYLWWAVAAVVAVCVAAAGSSSLRAAGEKIDYSDLNKIKIEGLQRSQAMDLASWLSDVYGARLTGSPSVQRAGEWAVKTLTGWGVTDAKLEPWTTKYGFERGWTNDKFYMAVTAPERFPIPGTPTAWTPGTAGLVSGEVVLLAATTVDELAAYKGTLKGKWVLLGALPDVPAYWEPQSHRYTTDQLDQLEVNPPKAQYEFGVTPPGAGRGAAAPMPAVPPAGPAPAAPAPAAAAPTPGPAGQRGAAAQAQRGATPQAAAPAAQPPAGGGRGGAAFAFTNARTEFLRAEGALGTLVTTPRGHGLYVISGNRASDPATTLPSISIAAEYYGRIGRILAKKIPVTIEADIKNTYYPTVPLFNVVGEIKGTDKADEVVLLGAHIDSWHAATGAADNAVGCAAMMEAMRILKASGVPLRRTVRIGLWQGEEQGLIGSREYVSAHLASRQAPAGAPAAQAGPPMGFGGPQGPLEKKPEFDKFSAYFNIDNGSGALRGIYLQGNDAAGPIFREWMEPFRALGMTTITVRNTGGTDHQSFDGVGLPGFQFIQDELEYDTITHHTNMDTYERLQPDDVRKMATIAAGFAYLAANRDDKLPRKPANAALLGGGRRGQ